MEITEYLILIKLKKSFEDNYKAQEINFNIFVGHKTRGVFAQQNEGGDTGIIYVGSNVYSFEQLCPSTYYEPGVLKEGSKRYDIWRNDQNIKRSIQNKPY